MLPARFLLFGSKDLGKVEKSVDGTKRELVPTLKLRTDRDVYRPGDSVVITIEISNPGSNQALCSLLVEKLSFELKGIEKMDTQWFATQRPPKGSKRMRGEHVFMDCSTPSIISSHIISSGATKTYAVQTLLPSVIPPSYKGATIRYLYYVKSTLSGRWLMLDNDQSLTGSIQDRIELEARIPLQVWVTQKSSGLLVEEGSGDGIVPTAAVQMDIYWKEMDGDSDWTRANDSDEVEEGYESSRDEISSVSSYNPMKESLQDNFGSSLSLQSFSARSSYKEAPYLEGGRPSLSSNVAPPHLAVAEVLDDSNPGVLPLKKLPSTTHSPKLQRKLSKPLSTDAAGDGGISSAPGPIEPAKSEGLIRGRSYNIKLDDRVLLRFSPKNSDSTYYFGDTIGGTLTLFHEESARRCLEISITLEISETICRRSVHPSRRNSPTITKVLSDHHEVVVDLVQTSFLFSIPMDGPMSFSTPLVSVKWALRFEFFTTPKNVDWTRYEHPLMIEGRERTDWVLPITVHAPPPGASSGQTKSLGLEPLWVRT